MPRRARRSESVSIPQETQRLLRERTADAVAVLVQLMQDEGQKPELRMKAAESILDRVCGKAGSATADVGGTVAEVRFEGVLEEWSR